MTQIGLRKTLSASYEEALERVPRALKTEGFGILTEIDVRDTLKQKLGVEFRRYRILGACNPPFAHQALQLDPDAGLMMPCSVIVYEGDDGRTVVAAVDPTQSAAAQANPRMMELAATVRDKLARALAPLE